MEMLVGIIILAAGVNVSVIILVCITICKQEGPCSESQINERRTRRQQRQEERQRLQTERRQQQQQQSRGHEETEENGQRGGRTRQHMRQISDSYGSNTPSIPTTSLFPNIVIHPSIVNDGTTSPGVSVGRLNIAFEPSSQLPSYEDIVAGRLPQYQPPSVIRYEIDVSQPPSYEDILKEDGIQTDEDDT